jgi:cyclic pyranopterin phosphate synthase
MLDTMARPLKDLRISVTDRCNFRCRYCMPREVFDDFEYLGRDQLLTFEEITIVANAFAELGINKIRLTGGEPLMRKNLPALVEMLSAIEGIDDIAMTTNASLLSRHAVALRDAGLDRLTISLDSINTEVFDAMTDSPFGVPDVLEGIAAAEAAGFGEIKINAVVQRGVNDHTLLETAEHFRGTPHILRFIEYMDVGTTNGWAMDQVVTGAEIVDAIATRWPVEPTDPNYLGEVAKRYRYTDGQGEIGVITSVSAPFCDSCTRARLSAEGSIYTCLFASGGTNLNKAIKQGHGLEELKGLIASVWLRREDRYSQIRSDHTTDWQKVEMSFIGG